MLKEILEKLYFVNWDRYTQFTDSSLAIYGWITREKDSYKDFLFIEWDGNEVVSFLTSSKERDEEINNLLGFSGGSRCVRVESLVDITNSIKL